MNTFGVDFQKHLKATKRYIPIIVTECIAEIDLRGLDTRGLYRVSSAKSKIEHLCQLFETGGDRVDLSDRPAHLIGSCLKLYFRQVSEILYACFCLKSAVSQCTVRVRIFKRGLIYNNTSECRHCGASLSKLQ